MAKKEQQKALRSLSHSFASLDANFRFFSALLHIGRREKTPHPQDKIQHLDLLRTAGRFTTRPLPAYFTTKMSVARPFWSLVRTKLALSKAGRFLSKAEILGAGVFFPPFKHIFAHFCTHCAVCFCPFLAVHFCTFSHCSPVAAQRLHIPLKNTSILCGSLGTIPILKKKIPLSGKAILRATLGIPEHSRSNSWNCPHDQTMEKKNKRILGAILGMTPGIDGKPNFNPNSPHAVQQGGDVAFV